MLLQKINESDAQEDYAIADDDQPYEKRPRHYAQEICAMKTREARIAALDSVPDHLRDWVRLLVELTFARQRTTTNQNGERP